MCAYFAIFERMKWEDGYHHLESRAGAERMQGSTYPPLYSSWIYIWTYLLNPFPKSNIKVTIYSCSLFSSSEQYVSRCAAQKFWLVAKSPVRQLTVTSQFPRKPTNYTFLWTCFKMRYSGFSFEPKCCGGWRDWTLQRASLDAQETLRGQRGLFIVSGLSVKYEGR